MDKAPADALVGRTVAHYEIVARLGGGGMGLVYAARDTRLGRHVALKFLPPQWSHDESAKERFIREAQAASATDHPNICTIHDIGIADDGQLFIVMAQYEGETLKKRLESGPLGVDEAIDIAAQVAEGLAKAHAQGVVHRDIKPGNLMLTADGVRILDFGLAKFADARFKLTLEGSTVGTIAYMSPEQARGDEADARSDIWAVGAVLYEMLAGEVPFKGGYPEAIAHAIKHEPPAPLRAAHPDVSEALEQLVFRALHKDPAVRFQTTRDLARALRRLQGRTLPLDLRTEPLPLVTGMSAARPRRPWSRRSSAVLAALVAVFVGAPLWLFSPVGRVPIVVAPLGNQTGYAELDPYRMALTQTLTAALAQSQTVRPLPYDRLLQITRRFRASNEDVSSREALQALAAHARAEYLIVPTLVYDDGRWYGRLEIRRPDTATNVAEYITAPVTSSLIKETSYEFVPPLAAFIDEHFTTHGPLRGYVAQRLRKLLGRSDAAALTPRTLDAAAALERALDAYSRQEYGASLAELASASKLDPRSALIQTWRSRVALIMRRDDEAADAATLARDLLTEETPRMERLFAEAVAAEARRDFTTAATRYRELVDAAPDDSRWLMELAAFQDRRSDAAEAAVMYLTALRVDPTLARAHVELCRLYAPNRLNEVANGRDRGKQALQTYRDLGDRPGEAQALLCLADIQRTGSTQEREEARRHSEEAITILKGSKSEYQLARAYYYGAQIAGVQGRLADAVLLGERALSTARQSRNVAAEPQILMNLGVATRMRGSLGEAVQYYRQASALFETLGDEQRAAQTQANAAAIVFDHGGDRVAALRDVENALAVFRKVGDRTFEAFCLQLLGTYYLYSGRHSDAERELNRGIAIARERNLDDRDATMTLFLAVSRLEQGDYTGAETLLTNVIGDGTGAQVTRARIRRAQTRLRLGDFPGAAGDLMQASAEVGARDDMALNALLYEAQGELAYESGRLDEARRHFEQSAARWVDDQPDPSSIESRAYLGLLDALAGRPDTGRMRVRTSLAQAQKMGRLALEARARIFLARIEIEQRRFAEAVRVMEGVPIGIEPPSVGPELAAHIRYWRGLALGRQGDRTAAEAEQTAARRAVEALRASLPDEHREGFAARRDIRLMRQ